MKAAQLTGLHKMVLNDVPAPGPLSGDEVLLRIARVGVCGSDVHYYADGGIGSQIVQYPWTVGHEASGIVDAVGPDVGRIRARDRVAVNPALPCYACDQCLADRTHTCRNLRFLGCPGQIEGCLSEWYVLPETSCVPLADEVTLDQAALSEPLSVGMYGVALAGDLRGASVAVLGAGPIGLCTLMAASDAGASNVIVTDKVEKRIEMARACGASWAGLPSDKALTELERRLDIVFECCGQQEALDQAIDLLAPGRTLMLTGIPEANRISFDINVLRRNELAIRNVRRQNHCIEPALQKIASGAIDVDRLITHRFPLARAGEAFELADTYSDGVVKAVIDME